MAQKVRSVELARLTAESQTLIEPRRCLEFFRDQAADQFERHTSSAWRPGAGSMVNHRTLTSAMIDSRDFIAAKRRAETEVLVPPGPIECWLIAVGRLSTGDARSSHCFSHSWPTAPQPGMSDAKGEMRLRHEWRPIWALPRYPEAGTFELTHSHAVGRGYS